MKRILALASMYSTEERKSDFPIISEQVKVFSTRSQITLIHLHRDEALPKLLEINFRKVNDNLEEIEVHYRANKPQSYLAKIYDTLEQNRIARMVCKALLDERDFDQIHIHYSWPFITLGRELNLKYKLPLFLFTYDIDYRYLKFRKGTRTSLSSRLLTLFSIQNVKKIFSPTPALLHKISKNYRIGSKIDMLPFSVDTSLYNFKAKTKNKEIFLSLNEFTLRKYPNIVEELGLFLQKQPDHKLSVSLEAPDADKLLQSLQYLPSDSAHFFLHSEEKAKSAAIRSSSIAIILSESNLDPSVFNQASCCGCAILCDPETSFSFSIEDSDGHVLLRDQSIGAILAEMATKKYDHNRIAKQGKRNYGEEYIANSYHNEIKYY